MASAKAPGKLALVQDFVNTADLEGGVEELDSPEALAAWLGARDLVDPSGTVTPADLARAIELREGLRDALVANHDEVVDRKAIETINRASANARLVVQLAPDGTSSLEPDCHGVEGALARLLAIVHTSMAEGSWTRLKICKRDSCRWAFWDASRNRSGAWCSMAVCGNKEKAKAFRERRSPASN